MAQLKIYVVFAILVTYCSVAFELEVLAPQNSSTYAIRTSSSSISASIKYEVRGLLPSSISAQVCVQITSARNEELLPRTCFSAIDGIVKKILDGLTVGSYLLHLTLEEKTADDIKSILVTTAIDVKEIKDITPHFAINRLSREIGLHPSDPKSDFIVKFPLEGIESAINLVQVCLEVYLISDRHAHDHLSKVLEDKQSDGHKKSMPIMDLTCIPKGKRSFSLKGVTEGVYDIRLILRLSSEPYTLFEESEVHISLDARVFVEMLPTYNWQQLYAWHTIPMGLETRLPLGMNQKKEARIPEPWQLQLSMPSPCKYFLRMNVNRKTTVAQILDAAGKQCKVSASLFVLTADGRDLVDPDEDMESSNYFNAKHGLRMISD